ncbi:hypothetical protein Spb1_37760 [Planctopirus ephydatiae]|uniref:Uncharacterized protein n=1 Tax=Planctopirus ephydatiae TaxID=2528019 RepID=A0A518GTC0_9PLAN|nr:hypothetical protein Spb1_37760 [Planctopirus ephydatiae]
MELEIFPTDLNRWTFEKLNEIPSRFKYNLMSRGVFEQ